MLARPDRRNRPLGVQAVGQRDVDGVDIAVGQQRLIGTKMPPYIELLREGPRFVGIAAGHGAHDDAPGGAHATDETARDLGGSENSEAQRRYGGAGQERSSSAR